MTGADWAVERYEAKGSGPRVGVKDIIDIAGRVTGVGSKLVASRAQPARDDAPIVTQLRERGAVITAKCTLVELAYGSQGINPLYGTPTNPLSPELVPGGSSSGSAVGVASGDLDFALGTDTGGSVRIPAACCGIYGVKTSIGRISTEGVWPLAPSLDTIGPLAMSLDSLQLGLSHLLEDYDSAELVPHSLAWRLRTSASRYVEDAIDAALSAAALSAPTLQIDLDLGELWSMGARVMNFEAWRQNGYLLAEAHRMDPKVESRLRGASAVSGMEVEEARRYHRRVRALLDAVLAQDAVLALATVPFATPTLARAYDQWLNVNTLPFNFLGYPALVMPISPSSLKDLGVFREGDDLGQGVGENGVEVPPSLQLVGALGSEERLLATAKRIAAATAP
jgi:Asp-tRNA(Asn)/Glu-tRNA(Gln) amidotransferase A subunit family amidase